MLINGQVQNVATSQVNDQGQPINTMGRQGDLIMSELGGKYRAAALRGNVFFMSTLIAGVALPVNAINLVSKFTLLNPASSGKLVELIEFTMGIDSATEVVNGISLGFQSAPAALGTQTVLTAGAGTNGTGPTSTLLGAGLTSVCTGYVAGTLTNAAVLGEYPLGLNFDATAAGRSGNFVYNFDGKIIVPQNCLVTFMTTVVAETATPCGLVWAEWLP